MLPMTIKHPQQGQYAGSLLDHSLAMQQTAAGFLLWAVTVQLLCSTTMASPHRGHVLSSSPSSNPGSMAPVAPPRGCDRDCYNKCLAATQPLAANAAGPTWAPPAGIPASWPAVVRTPVPASWQVGGGNGRRLLQPTSQLQTPQLQLCDCVIVAWQGTGVSLGEIFRLMRPKSGCNQEYIWKRDLVVSSWTARL